MSALADRMTADAFLARPEKQTAAREELIDGVVVVSAATWLHQRVCGLLLYALETWRRGGPDRGDVSLPLDLDLDDHNVLAPDLLWFAESIPFDAPRAPRAPDLAVEVRSPSTWVYDVGPKRDLYEQHGVRELWLVDTASRTVLVYRRSGPRTGFDVHAEITADEQLESPLLPGFSARVGDLIPPPRARTSPAS